MKAKVKAAGGKVDLTAPAAGFKPEATLAGLVNQGHGVGLKADPSTNADIRSLKHTLLFGVKGVAAYADHAQILGQEDDKIYAFWARTPIETIRATPVVTVPEDLPIEDALARMAGTGVRRLAVVDRAGCLAGLLALDDVLDLLSEEFTTIGRLLRGTGV